MSKQLHDAILNLPHDRTEGRDHNIGLRAGLEAAAVLALTFAPSSGRPWKARADELKRLGHATADYDACREWAGTLGFTGVGNIPYNLACAVADAMAPTFRAGVIADFIGDCWERGSPPTPAEIEPFLRPKVRALVWEYRERWGWWVARPNSDPAARGYRISQDAIGDYLLSGLTDEPELAVFATLELAQVAAQSHWESRAMAFWREAFEV